MQRPKLLDQASRATGRRRSNPSGIAASSTIHADSEGPRERCRLIYGDNARVLGGLAAELEAQVTLAYLDPPFFTGRKHQSLTRTRDAHGRLVREKRLAFDDRWGSLEKYLAALELRLTRVWPLLAPHGSLVLHVDPKTSHYCKVLCDRLFGIECFASEIIWRYRRWPSRTRNFQRVHDVLLRYVRDPETPPRFSQLYEPLAPSTRATWGDHKQKAIVDEAGRRERSSTTAVISPGTPLGDVWEIGIIAPVARERTGYPTQKPELLLERLVQCLSSAGDCVLDVYAGSATCLNVAYRMGRRSIGIDDSAEAIRVAAERLRSHGVELVLEQLNGSGGLVSCTADLSTRGSQGSAA